MAFFFREIEITSSSPMGVFKNFFLITPVFVFVCVGGEVTKFTFSILTGFKRNPVFKLLLLLSVELENVC